RFWLLRLREGSAVDPQSSTSATRPARGPHGVCDPLAAVYRADRRQGCEDTALYVYHPLLSLNEVGGDPRPSEAVSRQGLHAFLGNRRRKWPGSLNASSTHDTKRSEDVRARLNVLSEIPSEWKDQVE